MFNDGRLAEFSAKLQSYSFLDLRDLGLSIEAPARDPASPRPQAGYPDRHFCITWAGCIPLACEISLASSRLRAKIYHAEHDLSIPGELASLQQNGLLIFSEPGVFVKDNA